MKTVFDNRQLAHVWASQSQEHGRGSSFYFNGRVIYSYRDSWPLAVITPFRDADGCRGRPGRQVRQRDRLIRLSSETGLS